MKLCPACDKGTIMAGKRNLLRGKYNPTKTRRKYPNLQWATFLNGKRYKICATCIKQGAHLKVGTSIAHPVVQKHKKSKYIHLKKIRKISHNSSIKKASSPLNKKDQITKRGTHLEQITSRESRKNVKKTGRHE